MSAIPQTIRLTMAQAVVRYLSQQFVDIDGHSTPFFGGVWAIFGHGNVAGLGEALYSARDTLQTYRAHNEQGMAHAAIAFAKANACRRSMICTTSIGPGATNMVTAAALAHVNRLPVLFLPGDVFANRRPDPVLQQIEDFDDGTISANDCFRPVSRYYDRITRPEQILSALPRAMLSLTSPDKRGPVTLGLCQDVQAESYDYPLSFFEPRNWDLSGPPAKAQAIHQVVDLVRSSTNPLIVAGGGVHYAGACKQLEQLATDTGIPVVETQAGKGALDWKSPQCLGAVGVTGTAAANAAAAKADLVIGIGTRLQDFTTSSRTLFENDKVVQVQINTTPYDAHKHNSVPVVADAARALEEMTANLSSFKVDEKWSAFCSGAKQNWDNLTDEVTAPQTEVTPSDAQVVGAVMRAVDDDAIVVCAAGGLPGELHKLWRTSQPGGYHLEYGFSCMGYEIAGGLGAALAHPQRDVYVMVGDGSYLMMNSEIATAASMGVKLNIVVLDNRGFGCINRLQQASGSAPFNNLLEDSYHTQDISIDFAAHASSLGASSTKVSNVTELETALLETKAKSGVKVFVIDTEPRTTTDNGGTWWDVAIPEVSQREEVLQAYNAYRINMQKQKQGG